MAFHIFENKLELFSFLLKNKLLLLNLNQFYLE